MHQRRQAIKRGKQRMRHDRVHRPPVVGADQVEPLHPARQGLQPPHAKLSGKRRKAQREMDRKPTRQEAARAQGPGLRRNHRMIERIAEAVHQRHAAAFLAPSIESGMQVQHMQAAGRAGLAIHGQGSCASCRQSSRASSASIAARAPAAGSPACNRDGAAPSRRRYRRRECPMWRHGPPPAAPASTQ